MKYRQFFASIKICWVEICRIIKSNDTQSSISTIIHNSSRVLSIDAYLCPIQRRKKMNKTDFIFYFLLEFFNNYGIYSNSSFYRTRSNINLPIYYLYGNYTWEVPTVVYKSLGYNTTYTSKLCIREYTVYIIILSTADFAKYFT